MAFFGRVRELGMLRSALDRRVPGVLQVRGPRGSGKSSLVDRATLGVPVVRHTAPPLPDPMQRAAFGNTLRAHADDGLLDASDVQEGVGTDDSSWERLLDTLFRAAPTEGMPLTLVVDDAHRLAQARSRFLGHLARAMARAQEQGRWVHVVLVSPNGVIGDDAPLTPRVTEDLTLGALPFRAAQPLLPGSDAHERLLGYTVLGGLPGVLRRVDKSVGWMANLRRLVLSEGAPFEEAGLDILERELHVPSRYVAILSVLARGEADWASIRRGVPDLTSSGQLAPYLQKLVSLGLVEARRSLDATPEERSGRYRLTEPFLGFWFGYVLAWRYRTTADRSASPDTRVLRDAAIAHATTVFPEVCRQFMLSDAMERLGQNAREAGSLWGPDYEIPVAGILRSGAAFYGDASWASPPARTTLARLDAQIRATRYGYGREQRIRIVFSASGFPSALERAAARRYDTDLIGAPELAGES